MITKGITYSEMHPGNIEDAANSFDTDETVKQIKDHDLKFEAVCNKDAIKPHMHE